MLILSENAIWNRNCVYIASWLLGQICLTGTPLKAIEVVYRMENTQLSTVLVILLLLPLSIFVSGSIFVFFTVRFASYTYPCKYHRILR